MQLEANTLDWLRDWMGFPETTRGLFTTGGSMATFNALLCARERYLGADIRRGVIYTSDQAHHSVLKAAKIAGVMPDRVRALPCDERYRLPVSALAEAIAADRRAGLLPFAVVSSAGTTNTGAVDPLAGDRRSVCRRAAVASRGRRLRRVLQPVRRGTSGARAAWIARDSLTLDPHKGMFLPYGTGALLVRDGAALRAAHEATADYLPAMPHPDDFYDPSQHGPDLSRGFPGLRVWLAVKLYGAAAFRDAIAEKRALALEAHRRLAALAGIVIDAPPELSLFAFHVTWPGASLAEEDAATRALMDATTARGPRDAHRRHGARPLPGARVRAQLPHRTLSRSIGWWRTSRRRCARFEGRSACKECRGACLEFLSSADVPHHQPRFLSV